MKTVPHLMFPATIGDQRSVIETVLQPVRRAAEGRQLARLHTAWATNMPRSEVALLLRDTWDVRRRMWLLEDELRAIDEVWEDA
jgi:hypothetical protein